ncbi:unnamed protein product [Prunus armeniaca]
MDGRRYNVMTTNIAESINSVLRFARMLPMVHLIGEIINLLVKWFTERRELALNCTTTLCPNFLEKKLRNRLDDAARMNVVKLNNVQFNVLDGDMDGLVDLTNNSCSCRKFQLEQLPCKHPHGMWVIPEDVRSRVVPPPMTKVMPGRRKKLRIPSKGEGTITRKYSRCSSTCHNKITFAEGALRLLTQQIAHVLPRTPSNLAAWCSGPRGCASTCDVLLLDAVRLCAGVPARSTVR